MENSSSIPLGKTKDQKTFSLDLHQTPHALVVGLTGSGKSNLLHLIICGALELSDLYDWKLVLIDPKRIELGVYKDAKLMFDPQVLYDSVQAIQILRDVCSRIAQLKDEKTLSADNTRERTLIVIDEFSDLMCHSPEEVEKAVTSITKEGAAYGVHIFISTSSPREEVYTQKIIEAFQSKIGGQLCKVSDSIRVLGTSVAAKLKGAGDMVYVSPGNKPIQFQAYNLPYKNIVDFVTPQVICALPSDESLTFVQRLARKLGRLLP